MKALTAIPGILAMFGGLYYTYLAVTFPGSVSMSTASAVQVTQVYSEATYYAVMAGALFIFTMLCTYSYQNISVPQLPAA